MPMKAGINNYRKTHKKGAQSRSKNPWWDSTAWITEETEWWEPTTKPTPLPEFIKGRANNKMKLEGNKVLVKVKGTKLEQWYKMKGVTDLAGKMLCGVDWAKGHD